MDRIRGKRFDNEPKLNIKKVFASLVAIIVCVMVVISIKKLFDKNKKVDKMNIQTAYFTVYENEKYGVIDSSGKVIIKPTYDEMIVIPNSKKAVFIITEVENNTYKTKVLNNNGSTILDKYSKVQAIENTDGINIWYEDNILKYEKDGLYGLIDFSGREIVAPEYNDIYSLNGVEKSIVIEKNGNKGIVNSTLGKVVIEPEYSNITSLEKSQADNGYIVTKDSKSGVISGSGKVILECNYSEVKQVAGSNLYVVKENNNLKIIDNSLTTIKDGGFEDVKAINGDNIVIVQNGKCGIINLQADEKVPCEYEDLKFASDNYYIAKKDGKYGVISLDNTVCLDFKYTSMNFLKTANFYQAENEDYTTDIISRDLEVKLASVIISDLNLDEVYMRVRVNGEYKYYNFNFEEKTNIEMLKSNTLFLAKKDGKYGYVNKNGELIVNYIYDDAKEQNEFGYSAVKKDGVWGVIRSRSELFF